MLLSMTRAWLARRAGAASHESADQASRVAPYDVEAIRADFPILAERPYGKPLVYLDNAASAQKPRAVIERMTHAYEHEYANVHRGLHYLANAATDAYEAARENVRRFLNAGSSEEIVFTAVGDRGDQSRRLELRPRPYRRGRRDRAFGDGAPLQHRALAFSARTQGRRAEMGRRRGRRLVLARGLRARADQAHQDRRDHPYVQCAGHGDAGQGDRRASRMRAAFRCWSTARRAPCICDVDVRDLDVDFYVVTGHKLYGPTGIGALYGKADAGWKRCRRSTAAAR